MPEELCQVSPKSHYGVLASHSDPSPCKIIITTVIVVRSVFVLHLCALALHFDIFCQTCLRRTVSRCENTLEAESSPESI